MISYEKFVELCDDRKSNDYSYKGTAWDHSHELEYDIHSEHFTTAWETGGASGASCWDDEPATPYVIFEIEKAPMKGLQLVLDEFGANGLEIPTLVEEGTTSDGGDYYGNYRDLGYERISYLKLYNLLIKKGILK